MKHVWLSALTVPEQEARAMLQKLKAYGLNPSGHAWRDDNAAMAWLGPREELCAEGCAFWAIMGPAATFANPETRYGLSLLALCVQSHRGPGFPIVVLQTDTAPLPAAELPMPLQRALILPAADAGTPAKLVAKVHTPAAALPPAYFFDMAGDARVGQWFEVHPTQGQWPGIIFGVDEGEIKFQAVGPAGSLPATSTLNYPMQGLKIDAQGRTFTAWAVRNAITPDTAYYVKVEGTPAALLFGAFSEESEAEMHIIGLR